MHRNSTTRVHYRYEGKRKWCSGIYMFANIHFYEYVDVARYVITEHGNS